MLESGDSKCLVSDVAYLNPKRQLSKNQVARCIDMSQLSTSGAFPSGWDMKPFNGGMRFINGDTLLARITPCLENGKTAYIDFLDKKRWPLAQQSISSLHQGKVCLQNIFTALLAILPLLTMPLKI